MAASSIGTCRCGLMSDVGERENVVIYFPCAMVSLGRCELQPLHFPAASSFSQLSFLHFLLFHLSQEIFPHEQIILYEKMVGGR